MKATHLSVILQKRPIILWVEDRLSKEYLSTVWQADDPFFALLVAGGANSLGAAVNDLRSHGHRHVFGLRDRDFGPTNQANWGNPNSEISVYQPDVFELENYLLDFQALSECRENKRRLARTASALEARAHNQAKSMLWYLACRHVLMSYSSRLFDTFPKHPSIPAIGTKDEAERHIKEATQWFASLEPSAAKISAPPTVGDDLEKAHAAYEAHLESGEWIHRFPGKELFRTLRGYIAQHSPTAEPDIDLAKSLGEWQYANDAVPQPLQKLASVLKDRVRPHSSKDRK